MKNSVVERGFIANSPSRTLKSASLVEAVSWIRQGFQFTKGSPTSSLIWGLGVAVALYGMNLLLSASTTASVAYTSALLILAMFFAGGICATSRQMERQGKVDASAVLTTLWEAKFNLALMGIFVSVIFMGWMTLAVTTAAVSIGSDIASAGSVMAMLMAVGPGSAIAISLLTALMILTTFALVFVSLPMVIDGDQDFLNAMLASAAVFLGNIRISLLVALVLVGLAAISMMVWFPLIALTAPLAIHSLWPSYRSLVE